MKIAYITERELDTKKSSGAITRDLRLLEILKEFSKVDLYFNDTKIYHKYFYLFNNNKINKMLFNQISSNNYDLIIISTFTISPYLEGYKNLKGNKIFYIVDSSFHEKKQKLSLKYSLLTSLLSFKEASILKDEYCAYLGKDEIKYIPNKYHHHCLTFPFFIELNENSFNNNGKLIVVGQYSYLPNYQMLVNINNIADKIDSDIYIYGQNIPKLEYKKNIKVIGYADTLDEIYKDARALLYTVDYGVGIKNKVLEAMSYGVPTIGYKEAYTNLMLSNNDSCVIVNTDKEVIDTCNNKDLTEISNNLHEVCQKHYSSKIITEHIKKEISIVVQGLSI